MKIVVLGDTHGRDTWELILQAQNYDLAVFIGDYFDSWDKSFQEQMDNFRKILTLKRLLGDKVILIIGNHDYHYTRFARSISERYSGHQSSHSFEIHRAVQEAIDSGYLQMAFQSDSFLFTHAGVTQTWLRSQQIDINEDASQSIAEYINELYTYKPQRFYFMGVDQTGDDKTQSPIWVRPMSLLEDAIQGINQVVGHTSVTRINPDGVDSLEGTKIFFIDAIGKGEYLIIEDGKVSLGKIALPEKQPHQKHKED
jgi:hypothetical protein